MLGRGRVKKGSLGQNHRTPNLVVESDNFEKSGRRVWGLRRNCSTDGEVGGSPVSSNLGKNE